MMLSLVTDQPIFYFETGTTVFNTIPFISQRRMERVQESQGNLFFSICILN